MNEELYITAKRAQNSNGFQCFVCKGRIAPNDKHGWTVIIEPRLITMDEEVVSPQYIWGHDKCVIALIPLAAYKKRKR